ncbi:hypothetical protein D2N39_12550 [Gemmobacter lutimaris]|uniref:XRE family transcriptional regulator n=1 Tax=Gemmobacter lutimaris TaxID=2306023 RepID=A0A398BPQ2_9RHOB|nr:hypothetical protein D2N39_12550 [Gemmobacter lutimaris]
MSQLRTYLTQTKTKQAVLAKLVGVSCGYMSELVKGDKTPGLELAVKIEDATGGAVPARSWVALPPVAEDPEKDVA